MKKSSYRPVLRVAGTIIVVLAVSFLIANALYALHPAWPLRRIFTRVAALLAFVAVWRHVIQRYDGSWSNFGFRPVVSWKFDLSVGFGIAFASGVALILLRSLAGGILWGPVIEADIAFKFNKALLVAFAVAIPEEIFFRGYVTGESARALSRWTAIMTSSVFFSSVHFIRRLPPPIELIPEAIGLILVGGVLSWIFLRTGSLSVSIGLHAGWIFFMKFDQSLIGYASVSPSWLWGGDRLATCLPAWPLFLVVAWLTYRLVAGRKTVA